MFEGRVAIVTGGARGIGAAITERLAEGGAHVAAGYSRNAETAEKFAAQIAEKGGSISLHQGNVGLPEDCERVVAEVLEQQGHIDYLINNAGITVDKTVRKMTVEDWHAVLRVNLSGAFYMTKAVLEHLLERGSGRIVNISSTVGETGSGRAGQLRRLEVRPVRPHQDDGTGDRPQGDHRQLRRAGLHRHRHVRRGARERDPADRREDPDAAPGRRPRGRARGVLPARGRRGLHHRPGPRASTAAWTCRWGSRPSSTPPRAATWWPSTPPTTPLRATATATWSSAPPTPACSRRASSPSTAPRGAIGAGLRDRARGRRHRGPLVLRGAGHPRRDRRRHDRAAGRRRRHLGARRDQPRQRPGTRDRRGARPARARRRAPAAGRRPAPARRCRGHQPHRHRDQRRGPRDRLHRLDRVRDSTRTPTATCCAPPATPAAAPCPTCSRPRPWGFICSDGGRGRDDSGMAGLAIVEADGLAGATVDARTARMGDGLSHLPRRRDQRRQRRRARARGVGSACPRARPPLLRCSAIDSEEE